MMSARPGNRIVVTSVTAANFSHYLSVFFRCSQSSASSPREHVARYIRVIWESLDSVCIVCTPIASSSPATTPCARVCTHTHRQTQCIQRNAHVRALKQVHTDSLFVCNDTPPRVSYANTRTRVQTKSPELELSRFLHLHGYDSRTMRNASTICCSEYVRRIIVVCPGDVNAIPAPPYLRQFSDPWSSCTCFARLMMITRWSPWIPITRQKQSAFRQLMRLERWLARLQLHRFRELGCIFSMMKDCEGINSWAKLHKLRIL